MIKKRIKKIVKLTILIAVRQIWKLLCNLYHLVTEPFLTLKILIKDRDKSQIFLISLIFLMPIIAYFLARIVWDYYRYGLIINNTGVLFIVAIIIQIILLLYLGYWVLKIIRKQN
jgi:energy-converting hydrogenase Eha subunit A